MTDNNNEPFNPNTNLHIPDWINEDYFVGILEKDEPNYVKILKFTPTAAIPPGENFTSIMLRIHMEVQLKDKIINKSYILKTMLDESSVSDLIKEIGIFPKELLMYQKYLPAFEALYSEVGANITLSAKCLFTEQIGDRINIVFEDLGREKYKNFDRIKGFDMEHMRFTLKRLAEFHAASAVYAERNGAYPAEFEHSFVAKNADVEVNREIYEKKTMGFKRAMAKWNIPNVQKYIDKYPTFDQYWKSLQKTFDTTKNDFNVLTHGDFWSSNIMFNYKSDDTINNVMFVDYQLCKWGSPSEDLMFLICNSVARDIKIKEFDHFIEIYHQYLFENLKLLGYKKPLPSLRSLQISMFAKNVTFYAFFAVSNHLVVILLPTDKDSKIETFMSDDEEAIAFRIRCLKNPIFVEAMEQLFEFCHRRGLFDFEDLD